MTKKSKRFLFVFLAIILAGAAIIYLNAHYAVIETEYGKSLVNTNTTKIPLVKGSDYDVGIKASPGMKKLTKLEELRITAYDENVNLEYLSEMNNLQKLTLYYFGEYCGHLETLPELPDLKDLTLITWMDYDNYFVLSDDEEYHLSGIEELLLMDFDKIDYRSLCKFENLRELKIYSGAMDINDLDALSDLRHLERISIDVYIHEFDISGLKNSESLKLIQITPGNVFSLENTDCFSELSSVEELILIMPIENIDGILNMQSLKKIIVGKDHLSEQQIEELESKGITVKIYDGGTYYTWIE